MKLVKENIEFERGLELKKAMNIGLRTIWEKGIEEINANMDATSFKYFGDKDYSGMTYVLYYTLKKMLKGQSPQDAFYNACIDQNFHGNKDYVKEPRKEIAKVLRDHFYVDVNPIFESIEFERGIEPKQALSLGKKALIKKWFDDLGIPSSQYTINVDLSIKVKGRLDLEGANITSLPDNLSVERWLDLKRTNITSLPDNLSVGGWLDIQDTNITLLPDNLSIGGSLFMKRTNITSLPDNINVEDVIED